MLPPRLFRVATFVVSSAGIGLTAMALFAPLVYLPLYLQLIEGSGPTAAGLFLSPLMGGVIIASVGGGVQWGGGVTPCFAVEARRWPKREAVGRKGPT